jgi:DNA mismatch repair protein MutS
MIDTPFIANDTKLDNRTQQILLITGPNMAGKSTYIRQVALLTLMAHVGSFVPARRARFGLVDRIFTRVGATDYLARGQSTFMVEMTETANILNNASEKSLVILDEIGRGTSTYDGLSIAWAVVEYLHGHARRRAKTLFATHYHELVELEGRLERVKNFNVAVHEAEDRITFLYHIVPGGADRSYGIYAAQLAGMPQETLDRAREILFALECKAGAPDEGVVTEPGENLPAIRGGKTPARRMEFDDIDIMQLDMFAPALPPAIERLAELDVNSLTPLQSMQILADLVEAIRRMKG